MLWPGHFAPWSRHNALRIRGDVAAASGTRRWCGHVFSVRALELLSLDKQWTCQILPELCTLGIIDISSIAELLEHITDVLALLAVELQFLF